MLQKELTELSHALIQNIFLQCAVYSVLYIVEYMCIRYTRNSDTNAGPLSQSPWCSLPMSQPRPAIRLFHGTCSVSYPSSTPKKKNIFCLRLIPVSSLIRLSSD